MRCSLLKGGELVLSLKIDRILTINCNLYSNKGLLILNPIFILNFWERIQKFILHIKVLSKGSWKDKHNSTRYALKNKTPQIIFYFDGKKETKIQVCSTPTNYFL